MPNYNIAQLQNKDKSNKLFPSISSSNVYVKAPDATTQQLETYLQNLRQQIINAVHPRGSIYMTGLPLTAAQVNTLFPGTTWEEFGCNFDILVGAGTGVDSAGNTVTFNMNGVGNPIGEYTHSLDESELPSHHHAFQESTTGSKNSSWDWCGSSNYDYGTFSCGQSGYHNNIMQTGFLRMFKRIA